MKLEPPWAYNAPPLLAALFSINVELTIFTIALVWAYIAPPRFLSPSVEFVGSLAVLLINVELIISKVAPSNIPTPPHGWVPDAELFINSEFLISVWVYLMLNTPPNP